MNRDEIEGCGISKVWMLPSNHWAVPACHWHDQQFDVARTGHQTKSRQTVDRMFLNLMLLTARTRWQRIQAYALYGIARTFGGLWWKK